MTGFDQKYMVEGVWDTSQGQAFRDPQPPLLCLLAASVFDA